MRRFDKHIPILSCLGDWARLRLILAHLSAHRDSEAVPGVDGGQGKNTSAISSCSLNALVRALGVKRRLLPRAQHVESLLGLAEGAGVFRMQIEAIRTPIDLRGAHLHQVA